MNSLVLSIIVLVLFGLGYRFYGGIIRRLWDINPERLTPAHTEQDGVDYIPARHWTVLFGHHFAGIAGAGPILGPVIAAAIWGWVPAIIWIVLGTIFIGGVHDFSSLIASVRNKGKSIADVSEGVLGLRVKMLFSLFIWLSLLLVVAVFAATTAKTLINEPRVVIPTFGLIIAAVTVGLLLYRWKMNQVVATLIGLVMLAGFIVWGYHQPIVLNLPNALTLWIVILLIYAYIASVMPVNILLQPRDYLSTFILLFGLIVGYIGIFLTHPVIKTPAFIASSGAKGPLWPMLCVFIACGAISGFHSLIASGTSSKQIDNEKDAQRIGYGAMVFEGILATLALLAVTAGLYWTKRPGISEKMVYPLLLKSGDWIGTFAAGFGQLVKPLFGIYLGAIIAIVTLNAFVMTTLDSATRITRYITEEMLGYKIKIFRNRYISTGLIVLLALWLALGNWKAIWPVFGASNQLVAALALLVITVYLVNRGKPKLFTLIPAIFMLVTTLTALIYLLIGFARGGKYLLSTVSCLLLFLAVFMLCEVYRHFRKIGGRKVNA